MLLLAVLLIVVVVFLTVQIGVVPPPNAQTLVRIRSGGVRVARGRLHPHAHEHLAEILAEAGVSRGFIAITSGHRVAFSWQIPGNVHQRLRNVMVNQ